MRIFLGFARIIYPNFLPKLGLDYCQMGRHHETGFVSILADGDTYRSLQLTENTADYLANKEPIDTS
jgi:hypothetical protein